MSLSLRRLKTVWIVIGALLLLAACAEPAPAPTAGSTPHAGPDVVIVPIQEAYFWQQAEDSLTQLKRLPFKPNDEQIAAVDQALEPMARAWDRVFAVQGNYGQVLVDTRHLAKALRTRPANIGALRQQFDALLKLRSTWQQSSQTTAGPALLPEIMARPEFQWQNEGSTWLADLWQRLLRAFQGLLDQIFGSSGMQFDLNIQLPLMALGVLAAILVLLFASRGLWSSMVAESALDTDAPLDDEGLTADGARRKAQELSTQGDYRLAVRYMYLSALLLLEEHGLLRYERWRTNREYLRSVAHLPEVALRLRRVVAVFDRVWYGFEPIDAATFEQYSQDVAELRRRR